MKKLLEACVHQFGDLVKEAENTKSTNPGTKSLPMKNLARESIVDLLANNLVVGRYLIGQLLVEVHRLFIWFFITQLSFSKYYGHKWNVENVRDRSAAEAEALQVFGAYFVCVMGNDPQKARKRVEFIKGNLLRELHKHPEMSAVYNARKRIVDDGFSIGTRAKSHVSVIFVQPESPKTVQHGGKLRHAYEDKYVVCAPGM